VRSLQLLVFLYALRLTLHRDGALPEFRTYLIRAAYLHASLQQRFSFVYEVFKPHGIPQIRKPDI
jgi:hypothetical protein